MDCRKVAKLVQQTKFYSNHLHLWAGPKLGLRRVKNDWVFSTVLTLISVYLSSIYLVLAVENFLECEAAIVRK